MQHAGQPVTRTLEPGLTLFSAAEIRVVLLPVGEAPDSVFHHYASLIVRHRQVELTNVRSFHKEAQKSPFKFFPWKNGNMHFKFLPEDVALQPSPLAPLHSHRRVLGVIGIMHCPNVEDIGKAYAQFEQRCKAFPDAFTVRCFAFEPSDEQTQEDRKGQRNFIMFPPGDYEHTDNHAEVVMHDFAACLLAELERWMLNASPAMVELSGLVDSPEFTGAGGGALEAVQTRLYSDEEIKRKKQHGRLRKAMGDHCLLAGSHLDAQEHYSTAVDLCRQVQDWVYLAAALEGFASAKALDAAVQHNGFAINQSSVFNDEQQWRTPRKAEPAEEEAPDGDLSDASRGSSAFGGAQFWAALRGVDKLEGEVRALLLESKSNLRKRGGLPLLVESDLKLARFLAGLHGGLARHEVSDIVSQLHLAAEALGLGEDRLQTLIEGAQVLGLVGAVRKRVLLLWQAVELSKALGFPNLRTLEVARKALEPPDDPHEAEPEGGLWDARRPLAQAAIPRSWPLVRAGCLESVLGLAMYAKQHTDVWDAASALLREHPGELSAHRMQSLADNLAASASNMAPADRNRPGPGPPPLLFFLAPRAPPLPQRPVHFSIGLRRPKRGSAAGGGQQASGPFLYDPFSAKREQAAAKSQAAPPGPEQWVCGEVAGVEVEVCNPSAVSMRIDKLVLEAEYVGDASMAPREYMTVTSTTQVAWKPRPVSLNIPANTKPVRIVLEGTPLLKGMLVLTGCRLTAFGGVSWFQPWSKPVPSIGQQLAYGRRDGGGGGGAGDAGGGGAGAVASEGAAAPAARVAIVEPLPLVQLSLQPAGAPAGSSHESAEGLGMLPPAAAASGGAGAGGEAGAGGPCRLRLLQGQVYAAQLTITNTSKVPVGWASVNIRQKDGGGGRLAVSVDAAALAGAMPLGAGQSCCVPLTFSAGVRSAHAGEEAHLAEVCLEYVSPEAAGPLVQADSPVAGGGGAAAVLGRHAVLPVEVHVHPSLQVSAVQFREVYLPVPAEAGEQPGGGGGGAEPAGADSSSGSGDGGSGDSSSSTFERRCVMEATVANRGRWPLQVWLGPALPHPAQLAAADYEALLPPAVPAAEGLPLSGLLPPGCRCTVAHIVDPGCTGAAAGGGAAGGGGLPARPPASFEEQQRQECAARLCQAVALYYRVDAEEAGLAADAALGSAPLVHGEVFNGLSYHSLALLQPCALTVRLAAQPAEGPAGEARHAAPPLLQLVAAPASAAQQQQQQGQGAAECSRFPALGAALGEPLSVTVTVTNHGASSAAGGAPAGSSHAGAEGGGPALQLEAAVCCLPVVGGELEEAGAAGAAAAAAAAHDLHAVWAGQPSTGLHVCVPPGGTVTQRLGLCLLAPGLYRVGLQRWQCRPAAAEQRQQQQQPPNGQQQQQQHKAQQKKKGGAAAQHNALVGVQPCYVLAAER